MKYSFSEANDNKSVTVVTLREKGSLAEIKTVALTPVRDMRKIRGTFDELLNSALRTDDYVQITLTDENDIPNAMSRLQTVYKNALELRYDNARTRANEEIFGAEDVEQKTAFQLFSEFFIERNQTAMTEQQSEYMKRLIETIEGEER